MCHPAAVGGFPEHEVERIFLAIPHRDAHARAHLIQVAPRQSAVLRVRADSEVDIPARRVGVVALDQPGDEGDDLRDMFRHPRVVVGRLDRQCLGGFPIGGDILFSDLGDAHVEASGPLDDLVVDVGEILDVRHLVTDVLEITAHHVARDEGVHVPQMRTILDGETTDVQADLTGLDRLEGALGPGFVIVDLQGHDILGRDGVRRQDNDGGNEPPPHLSRKRTGQSGTGRPRRSRASRQRSSTSASNEMPTAPAAIGTRLNAVMPGMVLTSRQECRAPSKRKSMRAVPWKPSRS